MWVLTNGKDNFRRLSGTLPLGGYAWQMAHYLLGFRSLGHDVVLRRYRRTEL